MLKKKNILITSIILIVTFLLIGCSQSSSGNVLKEKQKPKVEDAVTKYLDAIKSLDEKTIAEYSSNKPKDLDASGDKQKDEMAKALLGKIDYTIESTSIDGDKAMAKVKTKAVDFEKVIPEFFKQSLTIAFQNLSQGKNLSKEESDELYLKIFKDIVSAKDCTMKQSSVEIKLLLKDDKWMVDNSEDVMKEVFNAKMFDELNKKQE